MVEVIDVTTGETYEARLVKEDSRFILILKSRDGRERRVDLNSGVIANLRINAEVELQLAALGFARKMIEHPDLCVCCDEPKTDPDPENLLCEECKAEIDRLKMNADPGVFLSISDFSADVPHP